MTGRHILITGGARSGKSDYALTLALARPQPVLFVATAEAGDEEMRWRIEAHKKSRPDTWWTLEAPLKVGDRIRLEINSFPTVVVDCITLLVSNILMKYADGDGEIGRPEEAEAEVTTEIGSLLDCLNSTSAGFIIVTNEVGLGLVPASPLSRLYRDQLGRANRMLAEQVDEVCLMVAGQSLKIK
jgi:adenosylcobinamide kinase/adenosylcobinamide-phosphate guanylyltransferase